MKQFYDCRNVKGKRVNSPSLWISCCWRSRQCRSHLPAMENGRHSLASCVSSAFLHGSVMHGPTLEISWNNCSSVCSASGGKEKTHVQLLTPKAEPRRLHQAPQSQNTARTKYLNSPQCGWGPSQVSRPQVWWFPPLGREPRREIFTKMEKLL